jgi:hypothetical protein
MLTLSSGPSENLRSHLRVTGFSAHGISGSPSPRRDDRHAGAYTTLRMDGAAWPAVDVRLGPSRATAAELVRAAGTIAGTVPGQATREGEAIGWVCAAPQDDRLWTLRSAGVDLYGGRPGIRLFLAHAGLLTGDDEARSAARLVADGVAGDLRAMLEETAASARRAPLRAGAASDLVGGFGILGGALYFLAALTADRRAPLDRDRRARGRGHRRVRRSRPAPRPRRRRTRRHARGAGGR